VQVEGPTVTTTGQGTLALAFTAPDVKTLVPLTFELRANDGALLSPAAKVTVQVEPTTFIAGGAGCSAAPNGQGDPRATALLALATLALVARGRARGRGQTRERAA
jgi:hypothetical protein